MVWFVTALYPLSDEIVLTNGSVVKVVEFKFKDKQLVLVRDDDSEEWWLTTYKLFDKEEEYCYVVYDGSKDDTGFRQCIPYKGNEHLLGTTDSPDEEGE